MTLNPEKCSFAKSSVKFLGHMIDSEGIKPDPDKVSAIEKFTTPSCIGDVRRFLGMINQLSKFSPHLSEANPRAPRERECMGVGSATTRCHDQSERSDCSKPNSGYVRP